MLFTGAGVLLVAAVGAVWQSVSAYRWRDWRRFWIASALILPLFVGSIATIWAGYRYPTFNFWSNLGFGPNWECENLGRGGAVVCARGAAAPLGDKQSERQQ